MLNKQWKVFTKNTCLFTLGIALLLSISSTVSAKEDMRIATTKSSSTYKSKNYIGDDSVHSMYQKLTKKSSVYDVWATDPGCSIRIGNTIYVSVYHGCDGSCSFHAAIDPYYDSGDFGLYQYDLDTKKKKKLSSIALVNMSYYNGNLYGTKASRSVAAAHPDYAEDSFPLRYTGNLSIYGERSLYKYDISNNKMKFLAPNEKLFFKSKNDGFITFQWKDTIFNLDLNTDKYKAVYHATQEETVWGLTSSNKLLVTKKLGTERHSIYTINLKNKSRENYGTLRSFEPKGMIGTTFYGYNNLYKPVTFNYVTRYKNPSIFVQKPSVVPNTLTTNGKRKYNELNILGDKMLYKEVTSFPDEGLVFDNDVQRIDIYISNLDGSDSILFASYIKNVNWGD